MSENRHTPGPWEVRTREQMTASGRWQPEDLPVASPLYVIGDEAGDLTLVSVLPADPDDTGPDAEMLANAALMAAAPELLAALEASQEILHLAAMGDRGAMRVLAQAHAAIAKAKGGES